MIYLITGVAGNLGNSVAARLLADGKSVRGLALPGDPAAARVPGGVDLRPGDITDTGDIARFFHAEPGEQLTVIHCAAVVTVNPGFSRLVHDVNVTGTRNIIDACLAGQVHKLVYVSSTGAIPERPAGTPITEVDRFDPDAVVGYYGQSKAAASQLVIDAVREHNLDATLVFPTGIAGPDDHAFGPVSSFVMDYCHGKLRAGVEGSFNAVDVRDLADAIVTATERGGKGEDYILGSECVSMSEMFVLLAELTDTPVVTRILPASVGRLLGTLADLVNRVTGSKLALTSFAVYNLTRNNEFSSAKARAELGFTTRPFAETLADTVEWLTREGRIPVPVAPEGTSTRSAHQHPVSVSSPKVS